jgi:hypothetical protein
MNNIKVHRPINRRYAFEADEFVTRNVIFEYELPTIKKERFAEEAAELVFHITNAPEEMLSEEELEVAKAFRAKGNYSLSTGDIVEVDGEMFLCESFGWKKVDPSTVEALHKHAKMYLDNVMKCKMHAAKMQAAANSNHGQDL